MSQPKKQSAPTKRDAQSAATRRHLLQTAASFFKDHPPSELTLPRLARLAGVTPPTAYKNFPTTEHLMRALYDWLLPQLGTREPLPPPEHLHEVPSQRFPRFLAHEALLRAIWTSGSWSGQRRKTRSAYVEASRENLRSVAPELSDRMLLVALGPISSFSYPPMWQWFRDVMGMTEREAELAAAWATRALVAALADDPPSDPALAARTKRSRRRSRRAKR